MFMKLQSFYNVQQMELLLISGYMKYQTGKF